MNRPIDMRKLMEALNQDEESQGQKLKQAGYVPIDFCEGNQQVIDKLNDLLRGSGLRIIYHKVENYVWLRIIADDRK